MFIPESLLILNHNNIVSAFYDSSYNLIAIFDTSAESIGDSLISSYDIIAINISGDTTGFLGDREIQQMEGDSVIDLGAMKFIRLPFETTYFKVLGKHPGVCLLYTLFGQTDTTMLHAQFNALPCDSGSEAYGWLRPDADSVFLCQDIDGDGLIEEILYPDYQEDAYQPYPQDIVVESVDSIGSEPCWTPDPVENRGDFVFFEPPDYIRIVGALQ